MPEALSHKVGPLPVVGWIGVVGGAFVVSRYLRGRTAAGAATVAAPVLDMAGLPAGGDLTPPTTAPGYNNAPTTNAEWATRAFSELIGRGFGPASVVDDAIRRYIAGQDQPGANEQAIVDAALRYVGSVPDPIPPTDVPPIDLTVHPSIPAPPATTPTPFVTTPPPPANAYSIGQAVSAGENIVSSAYSPIYGWLNETSKGGIYTSGGSQPIPGSYLGYVAGLPGAAQPAELATHGQFAAGGLGVTPAGGYVETNTKGETYKFGPQ